MIKKYTVQSCEGPTVQSFGKRPDWKIEGRYATEAEAVQFFHRRVGEYEAYHWRVNYRGESIAERSATA